jgi:general secretion pathway protein D
VNLEFEILNVNRSLARDLGVTPPTSITAYDITKQDIQEAESSAEGLVGVISQIFGLNSSMSGLNSSQLAGLVGEGNLSAASLLPPLIAFGGGDTTFLATLPGAAANFSEALNLVRTGQRILIRAEDGQPATFFVGDRYPVTLGQYSSSLGHVDDHSGDQHNQLSDVQLRTTGRIRWRWPPDISTSTTVRMDLTWRWSTKATAR